MRLESILLNGITRGRVSPVTMPQESPGHANTRAAEHHWRFGLGSRMPVRLYAPDLSF